MSDLKAQPSQAGARLAQISLYGLICLTPILTWLAPLAFAPVVGLCGLLTLPGVRLKSSDRTILLVLVVSLVWACGSTLWSPYVPPSLAKSTALKLVPIVALYYSAVLSARLVPIHSVSRLLQLLIWGTVLLAVVMVAESLTYAGVYRALRQAIGDPIRPDLGVKNVAQGLFILCLLVPVASAAALRFRGGIALVAILLVGTLFPSFAFGYDAPIMALGLGALGAALVWYVPTQGPRILAAASAIYVMGAPVVVWGLGQAGLYEEIRSKVSLSWSQRMGYWAHAQDWIAARPLQGWGLDASRAFGPGIQLHPHDGALQVWMELGLIGAVVATILWGDLLTGLSRKSSDLAAAASAGSAIVYLTFGAVSFGVWQEWWLAAGALTATLCALLQRNAREAST